MLRFLVMIGLYFSSNAAAWEWTSHHNQIYFKDTPFSIKGFNWFGGDNNNQIPEGLWVHPMSHYLYKMKEYRFNAIRIPISMETILNLDQMVRYDTVSADPTLQGKTIRDVFHTLFYLAHDMNMTILLDFHTIRGAITEYPYLLPDITPTMTQDVIIKLLTEFSKYPNLMGIDIKNEPHGGITWSEWERYCTDTIRRVRDEVKSFKGLFFVEGVQAVMAYPSPWGGSFNDIRSSSPLVNDSKVVFSPHVYGVSVRGSVALSEDRRTFHQWFGFLKDLYENPIVLGEVGGLFVGDDKTWHLRLRDYLLDVGINDAFYWCLNPDSIDTGGILQDDWTTLNQHKIEFLDVLQTDPTILAFPQPVPDKNSHRDHDNIDNVLDLLFRKYT